MKYLEMFENFQDYSNDVSAIMAITLKGKVLILQRGSTAPWMPLKWSLVGGGVDDKDGFDDDGNKVSEKVKNLNGAIREADEEIKMIPTNVKYITKLKTKDIGMIHYYTGEIKSDKVNLEDANVGFNENVAYKFISKDEIDDYEYVPYVKEFIKKILKK